MNNNLGSVYLGGYVWPIVGLGLSGMRLQVHAQIVDDLEVGQELHGCRIHGSDATMVFNDPAFVHVLEENIFFADEKAPHMFQFGLLISKPPPVDVPVQPGVQVFDAEVIAEDPD